MLVTCFTINTVAWMGLEANVVYGGTCSWCGCVCVQHDATDAECCMMKNWKITMACFACGVPHDDYQDQPCHIDLLCSKLHTGGPFVE